MKQIKITSSFKTERFKINPKTKCWEWLSGTREGYGVLGAGRRNNIADAHRISFSLLVGVIPKGMCVLHYCDNRRCFNPKHLSLGSRADNSNDRDAKNRTAKGESHYRAKVSLKDVKKIRELALQGVRHSTISDSFGITRAAVTQIVRHKNWK